MRYTAAVFSFSFAEAWEEDVFAQSLFDLGFDTLDGTTAYIPTAVLEANRGEIDALIARTEGVELLSVADCPDEDWNSVWESEHPVEELPLGVKIIPHCAFGAGHHETTGMLINALLTTDLTGKTVLDNGCGTGVLGIFAAKRGAARVVAVDIDDKSVANTEENAALNGVSLTVLQGDTPPSSDGQIVSGDTSPKGQINSGDTPIVSSDTPPEGQYDLIMSNIHRNILLAQMPRYAALLRAGGELWLSGFYTADCPALIAAAADNHLCHLSTQTTADWCFLRFAVATR